MGPGHPPADVLPTTPFHSKPSKNVTALKLFPALLVALLAAYFCSQLNFSEIGEKYLPGAMPYVFQHHPGQNLRRLLSEQLIYAIETDQVSYVLCPIPKTGCSYHLGLVRRMNGVQDYEVLTIVHNTTAKLDQDITRFSTKRIAKWLADPNIPRYAVIRNPLMRTLSAYLDKVEPYMDEKLRTPDSFEKWVKEEFPPGSGRHKDAGRWNMHWRPQINYCGFTADNVLRSMRLFRFEEPAEIVDYLYSFIPQQYLVDGWGTGANVSLREFMLGPRKRSGGTEEKFLTYFRSVDTFDGLVAELQDDIDSLGYQEDINSLRKQVLEQQTQLDN